MQSQQSMALVGPEDQPIENEQDVLNRVLPFSDAKVLELGCGAAEKTRVIAEQTEVASITAVEIDPIQHQKNLTITDLPKVRFESYGAEDIYCDDNSFDLVLMFKSLHHVPMDSLDRALQEIHRVLKPGGLAYISEPVFAGAFNNIMRLFHDEQFIRQQAFNAVSRAVDSGIFELQQEHFFKNRIKLRSFEQYQLNILNVTHTDHQLDEHTLKQVKERFLNHESDEGYVFEIPNRIDLLKKPM